MDHRFSSKHVVMVIITGNDLKNDFVKVGYKCTLNTEHCSWFRYCSWSGSILGSGTIPWFLVPVKLQAVER